MRERVSITKTTRGRLPSLPFAYIKEAVLGKRYILSIVFIGDKKSRQLNRKYRKEDTAANVLSFPLSKTEGEIFVNPQKARRDAREFGMSEQRFILHLLIHAMLHLKGMRHGSRMKEIEQKLERKFLRE